MKYISALLFIFVIVIVILADGGSLPHSIRALYDFPNGDKLGHFILFGLLNFFLTHTALSTFRSKPRRWTALLVCLILALLIALEETSQRFFSARTFDLLDLLASYLGLLVGGGAAYKMKSNG